MQKSIFIISFLLCINSLLIQAQQVVPASGGDSSGSGGSGSYSVGQLFYRTNTSATVSETQGVQQAFEFQILSNTELISIQLKAVVYPNPTKDFIILKITDSALNNLRYTLFDLNGKSILRGIISGPSTQIRMQNLSIGGYLLKVNQQNKSLKTFKIIKHQ